MESLALFLLKSSSCIADDFIVVKLSSPNFYYVGFTVGAMFLQNGIADLKTGGFEVEFFRGVDNL